MDPIQKHNAKKSPVNHVKAQEAASTSSSCEPESSQKILKVKYVFSTTNIVLKEWMPSLRSYVLIKINKLL